MKIDAATMDAAVRTVSPATKGRHMPVLSGVRLESNCGELSVMATDLDLTIATLIDADGPLEPCVVPAALLGAWLGGAEGEVALDVDDADLVLTGATGTMRLRTLPVGDWPVINEVSGEAIRLTDDDRAKLLGILYAASRDGARPTLNGVGIGDGWACCTDSYQLAATKLEGLPESIIPVRLLELALKGEGEVRLTADDRRVSITSGATTYTGRLIEGRFPNWQPLVGTPKTMVTLDRERTIAALDRVLVLAAAAETPVRITPDGDGLAFTVISRDVGEIVERVAGGSEIGDTYGFRPRLLLSMLRSRVEAKVELGVTDSFRPVSIRDDSTVALVMPVRLAT